MTYQQARLEKQKAEGTYMTKAQREKAARDKAALEAMIQAGLVQVPAEGEKSRIRSPLT